jgi:uncharacterized protein (TIGR00299 family) protein
VTGNLLFLESVAGVAGDMFCASFVDAGLVPAEELQALPRLLGLPGVSVDISHPLRATMRTTHIGVTWANEEWKHALHGHGHTTPPRPGGNHGHRPAAGADQQWHTPYLEVDAFLAAAPLDTAVTALARKVFRLIAEAEAEAHGTTVDQIVFHEVGAIDSIMDVVMAAYCVTSLAPTRVYATPLKLGRGTVTMAHGTYPVPPPAVARLVVGVPVDPLPPAITRANVELTTPTGAAILKALDPTFTTSMPAGTVRAQGMGSGTMDLGAYPNVFRVSVVEHAGGHALPYETDRVVEITCNMDDETPERSAWVMEHLMTLGALDVWLVPVTGKKGRAAVCLSVLADEAKWTSFADWLLRYSSTFGLRHRVWDRLKLARRFETRTTADGIPLPVKIGMTTSGEVLKEKVEFDDVRKLWDDDPGFKPGHRP